MKDFPITRNMTSVKGTGNPVANQYVTYAKPYVVFQSYDSIIAVVDKGQHTVYIGEDWHYSRTTDAYRNKFFDEMGLEELSSTAKVNKALADGYVVVGCNTYGVTRL